MVIYMARYLDSGAICGIFKTFEECVDFIKGRIEHKSHYAVVTWDLGINPLYLE